MATITASVAGGNWNTNAAWVGEVQPVEGDDVVLASTSGSITLTANAVCRSFDALNYKATFKQENTTKLTVGAATAAGSKIALRFGAEGTYTSGATATEIVLSSSAGETLTVTWGGKKPPVKVEAAVGKYKVEGTWISGTFGTTVRVSGKAELDTNSQAMTTSATQVTGEGKLTLGTTKLASGAGFSCEATASVSAASSTIELTEPSAAFAGGGKTYGTVVFTASNPAITGSNTFGTLKFNNKGQTPGLKIEGGSTQTVTTIETNGTAAELARVQSSVRGTKAKIKMTAGTAKLKGLSFRDIEVGGGATFEAETAEDRGGNSGFTGFTYNTIEASAAGGNYNATTAWTGGVVPRANDDIVLGAAAGSITITVEALCRSCEASAYKKVLKQNTGIIFGIGSSTANGTLALQLGAGLTYTIGSAGSIIEYNSTAGTVLGITTAGREMPALTFAAAGKWQLQDKLKSSSTEAKWKLEVGSSIDTNGQEAIFGSMIAATTTTITLGASTVKLTEATGGTIWNATSATVEAGTSTIEITGTGEAARKWIGGGKTYATVVIASDSIEVQGSNTFAELLVFTAGKSVKGTSFEKATTQTITVSFRTNATAVNKIKLLSSILAKEWKLKKTGGTVSIDYCELTDSHAEGTAAWYAGAHGVSVSNNTTWKFEVASHVQTFAVIGQGQAVSRPTTPERILRATGTQAISYRGQNTHLLTRTQASTAHLEHGAEVEQALSTTQSSSATKKVAVGRALAATTVSASALSKTPGRILSQAQGQSIFKIAVIGRTLSVAQAQAITRTETMARTLPVSQAQSILRTVSLTHSFALTQPSQATQTHPRADLRTLTATQAQAITRTANVGRALTLSQAQAITRSTVTSRTLSAAQAQSISRSTTLTRTLLLGQAQSASQAHGKASFRALSATQAQSASKQVVIGRSFALSQPQAISRLANVGRALSSTQACSVVRVASLGKRLTVVQGSEAVQVHGKASARALSASQGSSATEHASPSRRLSAVQPATILLGRSPTRRLTLTQAQQARIISAASRALSTTQGSTPVFIQRIGKPIPAIQSSGITLSRDLNRVLEVGQAQSPTLEGVIVISFKPGRLSSSVVWEGAISDTATGVSSSSSASVILASTSESVDASSVEPDLLIESTVD